MFFSGRGLSLTIGPVQLFGSVSYVPHGGIFAVLAGGVTNRLMYLVAWLVGGLVGAILLNVLVKKPTEELAE